MDDIIIPEPDPYRVYVQTDERSRITAINSSAFVDADWGTEIDQGYGDKYHHAQGNYLPGPLYTEDGIPRYKLEDGEAVERSEEEIAADREARPEPEPTLQEQMGAAVRLAKAAAQNLTDAQALEVPELYEQWAAGTAYDGEGEPQIVRRPGGQLYRCRQAHTSQAGWEPENTPAMWTAIDQTHAGTLEDPIPAARGMEYQYGLYYLDPEDSKTYLCSRTGEEQGGTVVLQYLPHELVGQYFEEADKA